jgi:Ca2+-transporting ATPase
MNLPPWCVSTERVLASHEVDPARGLSKEEVQARRARFGTNELRSTKRRSAILILADQVSNIVVLLLATAAVVAALLGEPAEALAIAIVIALNAGIGFITELRAVRSMEALRRLARVSTVVRRDGAICRAPAEDLVPGDIVLREGGDVVTADVRLIESSKLEVDESTLTGESTPVAKQTDVLPQATAVMDRTNMLFKGTAVTTGSAVAVVVGTGHDTELGKISRLVAEAESMVTPLEKRLDALGRRLVWLVLVLGVFIAVGGILAGRETWLAIEVAIALAVAAIPEGLPVVATIALARGMWRMARRNALISRLSAVETLGATSVILTDKTGTLTENRMTLATLLTAQGTVTIAGTGLSVRGEFRAGDAVLDADHDELVDELLTVGALCNNASIQITPGGEVVAVGDPTEIALLVGAAKRGLTRQALLGATPEVKEVAFDTDTRAMATFHEAPDGLLVAVKGSPEAILEACAMVRSSAGALPLSDDDRVHWLAKVDGLAAQGLRTLAIATKLVRGTEADPYRELTLLGIAGILDPPRDGVAEAIERCRSAGIKVVMITGDHAETARNIAARLGLVDAVEVAGQVIDARTLSSDSIKERPQALLSSATVIARATPEQKLALIALYQHQGNVVAMTGDGVNDAPALKQADIGVAMGLRGTQVAKEASAMVLQDDNFATIVEAVAQGRTIYGNIRKFVVYLMSCNMSEILIVSLATLAGAPLPLLPLQILFLNLVTDIFPALALGVGEGSAVEMARGPRPADEPLLARRHWEEILVYGIVISLAVLGTMATAILIFEFDTQRAVSVSFCTLALAQLWHVFNMRDRGAAWVRNEVTTNPWVWAAVGLCVLLVILAVYVPGMSRALELADPGTTGWLLVGAGSAVPVLAGPLVKSLTSRP